MSSASRASDARREPDQVGEQHRHEAPLGGRRGVGLTTRHRLRRGGCRAERRAALVAELLAAARRRDGRSGTTGRDRRRTQCRTLPPARFSVPQLGQFMRLTSDGSRTPPARSSHGVALRAARRSPAPRRSSRSASSPAARASSSACSSRVTASQNGVRQPAEALGGGGCEPADVAVEPGPQPQSAAPRGTAAASRRRQLLDARDQLLRLLTPSPRASAASTACTVALLHAAGTRSRRASRLEIDCRDPRASASSRRPSARAGRPPRAATYAARVLHVRSSPRRGYSDEDAAGLLQLAPVDVDLESPELSRLSVTDSWRLSSRDLARRFPAPRPSARACTARRSSPRAFARSCGREPRPAGECEGLARR